MKELKLAVKALPSEKSPGIDGIPAEFYQQSDGVTEWLHEILVKIGKNKTLTETMRTSV